MKEADDSILLERIRLFYERKIEVHVSAKRNGYNFFYNGMIKEINSNFIILHERIIGEIPIHFGEIFDVEKFIAKEEGENHD